MSRILEQAEEGKVSEKCFPFDFKLRVIQMCSNSLFWVLNVIVNVYVRRERERENNIIIVIVVIDFDSKSNWIELNWILSIECCVVGWWRWWWIDLDEEWCWTSVLDVTWINCNSNLQQEIRHLDIWDCRY
jgi:hypothetical protein